MHKLNFLGHTVCGSGISTDPDKIAALINMPNPTKVDELRAFLGLAGYYRRFVPNFGTIATPLTDLLKKDTKFVWGPAQQQAAATLKARLCSAPVLAYPDWDKEFLLHTDASHTGIGAVLSQEDSHGVEHPIAFASRALTPTERRYDTRERECLAILWSIEHFRHYLLGKHFTVFTDHQTLTWLFTAEKPERVARWRVRLSPFHFDIKYRAGASNANADGLSRLPSPISLPTIHPSVQVHPTLALSILVLDPVDSNVEDEPDIPWDTSSPPEHILVVCAYSPLG